MTSKRKLVWATLAVFAVYVGAITQIDTTLPIKIALIAGAWLAMPALVSN